MNLFVRNSTAAALAIALGAASHGADLAVHTFERQQLTDVYFSEGVGAGDIDGDGDMDVVYGPYWYAGPDFETAHEIYPPKPQPTERYADHFFAWVHDFDDDGANDVFAVGFPGTPAHVYQNPGAKGLDQHWAKHEVFDWVSNESPHFTDIVGDGRPELVCTRDGFFGYATIDRQKPFAAWTFHTVSEKIAPPRFGHGLGVGDINGDDRKDIIFSGGWLEQPAELESAQKWTLHEVPLTDSYGGAEMHAYDVDGDGDSDVVTSLAAHDFGLAWYEQVRDGERISFEKRLIMGTRPEQNAYGLVFTEPHSVQLADMDGDGLKDIVTGKTYYSHHKQSPMWDAGAVAYWFRLVRGADGVDWVPYKADGEAGIGRQVGVFDLDGDRLPDIITGGMKGAHVLRHRRREVSEAEWRAAQPKPYEGAGAEEARRGPVPVFDEATGKVAGAIEGEDLRVIEAGAGKVATQNMDGFKAARWSGGKQLFWTGAKPRARLHLELEVEEGGRFDVAAVFTVARDYAVINVLLDDEALGPPLDLFEYPDVKTTGLLALGTRELTAGKHKLTLEIIGANEAAAKAYMVGLDLVRLTPSA